VPPAAALYMINGTYGWTDLVHLHAQLLLGFFLWVYGELSFVHHVHGVYVCVWPEP